MSAYTYVTTMNPNSNPNSETQPFFSNPKLNQIFLQLLSKFSENKPVILIDEKENKIHALFPKPIEIRKGGKSMYKRGEEYEIETIVLEYDTKRISIWINENNQTEISTYTEELCYCGE